ncbi:hypothetical protein Patl1_09047 [Pistacia atlantica]|uniref:Uncharacterized protein n=1 Tax=Pistacia atlantica TaxID=434234 RepID=A0ACC1AEF9_9ROSI|nr:hypothetical protein Patl1_09047 [Pistacia atlantica]
MPCMVKSNAIDIYPSQKIPIKFVKHMGGQTSGSVSLIGPSGNTWHVNLIQQNGDLFFDQGWPTFVSDHFLECGDLLVFRYDGELHFTVQVFDQSACEKEDAFNSKCNLDSSFNNSTWQKTEREVAALSERIFQGVPKKIKGNSSVLQIDWIDKDREAISCEEIKQNGIRSHSFSLPSQSKPCNLKPEHEEKKVAQSFNSSFPYFVRIMKRFNISGSYTLNIPYQFSMAHLPKCKTEIVLCNLKGESWIVNSVPTTKVHTSHTFCGGWLAFVRSNEIKMGDVCIFELVRKCEFCVHIRRVGKEDPHSQNEEVALSGSHVGSAATSYKKFDGLSKTVKNSLKIHSKCMKKVQLCGTKESKTCDIQNHVSATRNSSCAALCAQSKTTNEKPVQLVHYKTEAAIHSRNNVEAEMGSPNSGNLRIMMALDEQKAAQSFTSHVPHFVRIMRKFNISGSYTLKIPYKFSMAHLPDCKTEILLRNIKGECWTVNSVPDSKGRMVHTFCGGWMAFVRGNDIKIWDICIFELINKCEMRVRISGVGRKELVENQISNE